MARKIKSITRRSRSRRSRISRSKRNKKYGGASANENTPPFNLVNYLENTETKMKDIAIQLIAKLYLSLGSYNPKKSSIKSLLILL